jgi:hypothetical protein
MKPLKFVYSRSIVDFRTQEEEKQFIFTGSLSEAIGTLKTLFPYSVIVDAIEQQLEFPATHGAHLTYNKQRMMGAYNIQNLRMYA